MMRHRPLLGIFCFIYLPYISTHDITTSSCEINHFWENGACVTSLLIMRKYPKINIAQKTGTKLAINGKSNILRYPDTPLPSHNETIRKNVKWTQWKLIYVHFCGIPNFMTSQHFQILITRVTIFNESTDMTYFTYKYT